MSGTGTQRPLSRIRVKDLRLRTFVGFNDEEQRKRQDVVVNIHIDYDALSAARGDAVDEALDYKTITKQVIAHVEDNRFLLLEKLVNDLVELVMAHGAVQHTEVEVDKPHALRFADSVSLTMAASRG
ncbi:dihydroneopterin triphosphate 2'-epimerase [Spiribacter vilamensis]|uniref:Dihydroneopterin triphosphate 2'-epimerase n=1 Tax=Spiribacter vilamensis TaxID=531306 RepID=A0A4Q8D2U5_9GAMM|nr:dihydroneopterin triphosphate 2'-epimerase [Spiribacter vilamensis]RZU99647.1 D-erythro-7,8-dihydroneopterin triphosphate epimerase [Spiribacter vilamensis]TVO61397.1 dihydroneopterin triphosphate 2'-epimerase [Spiribacter vilamensis]